jgi:hypothetical protein
LWTGMEDGQRWMETDGGGISTGYLTLY